MDHKQQLAKLDPKLKEAYDRVMGTDVPPPTHAESPVQTAPSAADQTPSPTEAKSSFVVTDTPSTPSPQSPAAVTPLPPIQAPLRRNSETIQMNYQLHPKKVAQNKKVPTPFIIAIVIIFFVIYTFAWVKIFNISVPFLGF